MTFEKYKILSESITVYLFDLQQFIKHYNSDLNLRETVFVQAEKLKLLSGKLISEKNSDKVIILKDIKKTSDLLLSKIKNIKSPDKLLIEKTDLLARTFFISEHCDNLLSDYFIS